MSQNDQQGLDGMDEHQSPSPADAGATEQEAVISGNGGTPGADRLGMRGASDDLTGEHAQSGEMGVDATMSGADMGTSDMESDTGKPMDHMDQMDQMPHAGGDGDSGGLSTRANTDRSGVPGGGLAEGIDIGDVTGTGDQADAGQEGANIQP